MNNHEQVRINTSHNGNVIRVVGDRRTIKLTYDAWVDDWVITDYVGEGVGMPGGIRDRGKAIEYAISKLGLIEGPVNTPVERC